MVSFQEISPTQAQKILGSDNPLLLDSRDVYSYRESHIEGAIHVHEDLISHLIGGGDRQRPVIIYCYQGNSSKDLAQVFSGAGFAKVFSISGGFTAWKKQQPQSQ